MGGEGGGGVLVGLPHQRRLWDAWGRTMVSVLAGLFTSRDHSNQVPRKLVAPHRDSNGNCKPFRILQRGREV